MPAALAPAPEVATLPPQAFSVSFADPVSGRLISPRDLRIGQFVEVRATLVTARPLLLAAFDIPIPAGLLLLDAMPTQPFVRSEYLHPAAVRYTANELQPGAYTQRYLARVGQPGEYVITPLQLTPLFEPANGVFSADPGTVLVNAP
ncbi:hypothetical protein HC891_01605 [Candidatus Gracilibacteria bacterium]|nr:hypothetical protein [Candidatus Gracilibacteria bacterium]